MYRCIVIYEGGGFITCEERPSLPGGGGIATLDWVFEARVSSEQSHWDQVAASKPVPELGRKNLKLNVRNWSLYMIHPIFLVLLVSEVAPSGQSPVSPCFFRLLAWAMLQHAFHENKWSIYVVRQHFRWIQFFSLQKSSPEEKTKRQPEDDKGELKS